MSTIKIEKENWTRHFDHLSNITGSYKVTIEVVGMPLGDQIAVENVDFEGVSYDKNDDVITVHANPLDHMVRNPTEVYTLEDDDGLKNMEITDSEGNKHILIFTVA